MFVMPTGRPSIRSECWRAAGDLSDKGVPIEAVTAWSLLGSVDWDSLLTETKGRYEAAAFDVSSGHPVAADLAGWLTMLARREAAAPAEGSGWWGRDERRCFAPEIDDPPEGLWRRDQEIVPTADAQVSRTP